MRELVFIDGTLLMGKGVPMVDGGVIEGNRDMGGGATTVTDFNTTKNVLMK